MTRAYVLPVAVYPILFPFAFYLSQALFRYRYPIDPVVMLLTALAAEAFLRKFSAAGRGSEIEGAGNPHPFRRRVHHPPAKPRPNAPF